MRGSRLSSELKMQLCISKRAATLDDRQARFCVMINAHKGNLFKISPNGWINNYDNT